MDCHVNNSLMISGSMDGTAKLWNSTSGKCVGTLLCGAKVKERHNSSMVNLNGPHPFVQGCIFSRKIIPLNRNVLKKNCIICPGVRGNYETYTHLPSLHLYFLNAFKTLSIYLAIILLWNPPMYPYLFIYLKRIAWVVPGPRQSHPSALPLMIRVFLTPEGIWLVRWRHVLFMNPGCKRTRV